MIILFQWLLYPQMAPIFTDIAGAIEFLIHVNLQNLRIMRFFSPR